MLDFFCFEWHASEGSKGGAGTPPGIQILSISCSFWEILAKLYVGAPGSWRPPRGNPGSATACLFIQNRGVMQILQ